MLLITLDSSSLIGIPQVSCLTIFFPKNRVTRLARSKQFWPTPFVLPWFFINVALPLLPFAPSVPQRLSRIPITSVMSVPSGYPYGTNGQKNAHSQLPHCTLHTGVASLPTKAQAVLAAGIPPDNLTCSNCTFSADDLALETYSASGHVAVYTDGCCLNQNSPLWRRAGYGVAYDVDLRHSGTVALPLLGLEQTAQRAELRAFLLAIFQDARPLRIFPIAAMSLAFGNPGVPPCLYPLTGIILMSLVPSFRFLQTGALPLLFLKLRPIPSAN